jgi:hypothetical protein
MNLLCQLVPLSELQIRFYKITSTDEICIFYLHFPNLIRLVGYTTSHKYVHLNDYANADVWLKKSLQHSSQK